MSKKGEKNAFFCVSKVITVNKSLLGYLYAKQYHVLFFTFMLAGFNGTGQITMILVLLSQPYLHSTGEGLAALSFCYKRKKALAYL